MGSQLAETIPPSELDPLHYVIPEANNFEFRKITSAELVSVLTKVNASKVSGLDKITGKLLKAVGNSITESLTYLFNLVLNTGIFPDDMKFTKVTPIYKGGEKSDCGNYRPISVISTVAKILEKLVGSRQRLQQSSYNPQIVIGNHSIMQVSNKKVLGVIIDEIEVERTQ